MRLLFVVTALAIGLLACERTPAPAAPEQPCACAAGQGNHTPSGRTQITR